MKTGVVIGKFYPPHAGHHYLIDYAIQHCDHLTVIVCDHRDQLIPGSLRAQWIREQHPHVEVVVTPDDLPDEPAPWAARTIEILGFSPSVVFTSEDYGDNYAKAMGASHVAVDKDRVNVPISASKIKQNPYLHWQFLSAPVREFFAIRVVLIGVESTGKTTLAESLADEFETQWVSEYGRDYAAMKVASDHPDWETKDFVSIAAEQQLRENMEARQANRILICDTNATATGVWHERYMNRRSPEVDAIGDQDRVDLYLLTLPDFPFVQDGTRDGEHIREWMHERFLVRLVETGVPVVSLGGSHSVRLERAKQEVRELLNSVRRLPGLD